MKRLQRLQFTLRRILSTLLVAAACVHASEQVVWQIGTPFARL